MGKDAEATWWSRLRRGVLVLVASAVAVGVVAGGPVAPASADPQPSNPPGSGKSERWNKAVWTVNNVVYHVWYPESLDPNDPHFKVKAAGVIIVRRVVNRGSLSMPSESDLPAVLQAFQEHQVTTRKAVERLKQEVRNRQVEIEHYKKRAETAETAKQRAAALKALERARKSYKKVFPEYRKAVKRAQPFDWDKEVSRLEHQIRVEERKAVSPRYTSAGREQARKRVAALREELSQTERDRDKYQDRGDGDASGASAKKKPEGPKTPSTGVAKGTPESIAKGGKSGSAKSGSAKAVTPKTTAVVPKVKVPVGGRAPGGYGEMVGEFLGQALGAKSAAAKRESLYRQALDDPKLRERILKEYERASRPGVWQGGRSFADGTFTTGDALTIGAALKKFQSSVDADAIAKKSNSDPLYQQARRECGGYDTCVKDRTKKSRDRAAEARARADAIAKKSNSDPLYQQARRQCGGYDTCVKDRTRKPRDQAAKKPDPAAVAKKQYEEANRVCGGYHTCVKDRLAKGRAEDAKAGGKKTATKTTEAKKTATKKTGK